MMFLKSCHVAGTGWRMSMLWCRVGAVDAVGTTGFWEVSPNAVNSVPRGARLEIDVRDIDGPRRDATVASIKAKVCV